MLNRDADELSRGVAISALALLAVWAEVPRDTILDHFAWLAHEGLERQPSYVWDALAAESADIEALAVFPDLRLAYDQGLIDPQVIGRSELDEVEASPRGALVERMKDRHPPIHDVAEATSWWARFEKRASSQGAEALAMLAAAGTLDDEAVQPYRAPAKVGATSRARAAAVKVQEMLRPVSGGAGRIPGLYFAGPSGEDIGTRRQTYLGPETSAMKPATKRSIWSGGRS